MKRREVLKSSLILTTTSVLLLPQRANAVDPLTGALLVAIVPSMISAITGIVSDNKRLALEQERFLAQERWERIKYIDSVKQTQARYISDWLSVGVTTGAISYKVAAEAYANTLANIGLSSNFDGAGTTIQVRDGLLYLERGGQNGVLHAAAAQFADYSHDRTGILPVPVSSAQSIDGSERNKAIARASTSLGMSDVEFNRNYVLGTKRKFSSARNPTPAGSDVSLYATFNRASLSTGGTVQAMFLAA